MQDAIHHHTVLIYIGSIVKLNKVGGNYISAQESSKPQHLTIRLTIKYSFWTFCKENINLSESVLTLEPNHKNHRELHDHFKPFVTAH